MSIKRKSIKTIYWIGSKFLDVIPVKLLMKHFPKIYDIALSFRWQSFMKLGDTVVQVGVNMEKGYRSNAFQMSKVVGEKGRVIAIEPGKKNIQKLKKFVAENGINNILIIEKAVWKEKGNLSFLLGGKTSWNRLKAVPGVFEEEKFNDSYEVVEADTLDNIIEETGHSDITHICLTINGAELEALEGMHRVLQKERLSRFIASGSRQKFRATVNGVPLNKKIVSVLEKYGFSARIAESGCVVAYKS